MLRIRIGSGTWLDFAVIFFIYVIKHTLPTSVDLKTLEIRFICYFWSIFRLLDSDSHSQYGSGSRRVHADRILNIT